MPALDILEEGTSFWVAQTIDGRVLVRDSMTGLEIWIPKDAALSNSDVELRRYSTGERADKASWHESAHTYVREPSQDQENALAYKSLMFEDKLRWVPYQNGAVLFMSPGTIIWKDLPSWSSEIPEYIYESLGKSQPVICKNPKTAQKKARQKS